MIGKVYLVGAGPGDPGLLTLKGKAALERADVIVYDFLANEELLRFAAPGAEKVRVPRRKNNPARRQAKIDQLLVAKARQGRIIVRLKGGDPFIFGRGGEEAEALVKARIPFEVVPGITAGYGAPTYAGIPVTHRNFVSAVTFITGHEDPRKNDPEIDWSSIAAVRGTLVFFMGVKHLPKIAQVLIARGRSTRTPVAVIRWGTRAHQQVITGTLQSIAHKAAQITPPAVTVVGDVVKLRDRLNWFERLPLFGKRIVITRAREQATALRDALEGLGAEVIELPTIEIRDPKSWEPLDQAIRRIEEFDYLLVTSANGVRQLLARLAALGRDVRDLKGIKIGAIGPATAAEFSKVGITVDFVPREYQAEGLLEALGGCDLRGKAFLIPRAKLARDVLPRSLAERGAHVEVVEAYETVPPKLTSGEIGRILNPSPDAMTFTSSSTAANFARVVGKRGIEHRLKGVQLASIGPITSATLRKLGLRVAIEAEESTIPSLVEAIRKYFAR